MTRISIILMNAYSIFAITLATKLTIAYIYDIETIKNFMLLNGSMIDVTISYEAVSTECC